MKPITEQEIKKDIKKALKKFIKENQINIHNLSDDNHILLNQEMLDETSWIKYYIEYRSDGVNDGWYQCEYYSEKLHKTVIFDYEMDLDYDGESIDLMVESIWQMQKDIDDFESRISLKA